MHRIAQKHRFESAIGTAPSDGAHARIGMVGGEMAAIDAKFDMALDGQRAACLRDSSRRCVPPGGIVRRAMRSRRVDLADAIAVDRGRGPLCVCVADKRTGSAGMPNSVAANCRTCSTKDRSKAIRSACSHKSRSGPSSRYNPRTAKGSKTLEEGCGRTAKPASSMPGCGVISIWEVPTIMSIALRAGFSAARSRSTASMDFFKGLSDVVHVLARAQQQPLFEPGALCGSRSSRSSGRTCGCSPGRARDR